MATEDVSNGSKMKVAFSLWLSETFKKRFGNKNNPPKSAAEVFAVPARVLAKPEEEQHEDNLSETSSLDLKSEMPPGLDMRIPPPRTPKPAEPSRADLVRGTRNECKTLDARYNKQGIYELKESSSPFQYQAIKDAYSLFDEYCMIVTRKFDEENKLKETTVKIQSPYLIKALRDIVKYYPDNPVDVGNVLNIPDPPALLYHYRKELASYGKNAADEQTRLHIDYALTYLRIHIGEQIEACDAHLAKGLVKFTWLWMIFRSGGLVYAPKEDQLYYFQRGEYGEISPCQMGYKLHCELVNYDGKDVGREEQTLGIPLYQNPRELSTLAYIPLEFMPDPEGLKRRLRERAQKFLDLRGIHSQHHHPTGRVMVDCATYHDRMHGANGLKPGEGIVLARKCECMCRVCQKKVAETPADYDHQLRKLSDDDILLTSSLVYGFSLSSHKWRHFRINDLSDIQWADNAIDRLVMDEKQKKVILSLVTSPIFLTPSSASGDTATPEPPSAVAKSTAHTSTSGDVIGWKGKGLVVLLHGTPGTGKTLTAECVCEHLHRPLYIVGGGELGSSPSDVERKLKDILDLSRLWNAIILIDEADVFLEQRSATDIFRNSLVSVFLRELEYFSGMLFLTTNRVSRFDDAFASRIHLALNYPGLTAPMRKEIWTNSLRRFPAAEVDIDFSNGGQLDKLAQEELNGRVISYAVRTAKALADSEGRKLGLAELWDVVGVYQKFNQRLGKSADVEGFEVDALTAK